MTVSHPLPALPHLSLSSALARLSSLSQASQRDGRATACGDSVIERYDVDVTDVDGHMWHLVSWVCQQPEGPSPKWTMGWNSTSLFLVLTGQGKVRLKSVPPGGCGAETECPLLIRLPYVDMPCDALLRGIIDARYPRLVLFDLLARQGSCCQEHLFQTESVLNSVHMFGSA
jgi:hypothetical protein